MTKRLSLTLESEDELTLEPFTRPGTPERDALALLSTHGRLVLTEGASDAAVLRALIRVGAEAIKERILDQAYQALAEERSDQERAEQQAIRDRQRARRAERDARD
jgi:hypothetical protein